MNINKIPATLKLTTFTESRYKQHFSSPHISPNKEPPNSCLLIVSTLFFYVKHQSSISCNVSWKICKLVTVTCPSRQMNIDMCSRSRGKRNRYSKLGLCSVFTWMDGLFTESVSRSRYYESTYFIAVMVCWFSLVESVCK